MTKEEIKNYLPQRDPFLMIDEITEIVPGISAKGLLKLDESLPFFKGHFPQNPIMPGALITEALAQTGGVALGAACDDRKGRIAYLAAANIKFTAIAKPPSTLVMDVKLDRSFNNVYKLSGVASVDGKVVAKGTFVLAEAKK